MVMDFCFISTKYYIQYYEEAFVQFVQVVKVKLSSQKRQQLPLALYFQHIVQKIETASKDSKIVNNLPLIMLPCQDNWMERPFSPTGWA